MKSMVEFYQLLSIPFYLLLIAIWGIMNSSFVLITILVAFELALLACSFNFIVFSLYLDDIIGQIFAVIILSVAGVESALGLAILIAYSRIKGDIFFSSIIYLKS